MTQIALGTFDYFNVVVSGVKGRASSSGIGVINDRLSASSLDEASSAYGLLAEATSSTADFSLASYRLRVEAKWHDGTPVTSDDLIFSFGVFQKYSPLQSAAYYR